MHITIGIDAMLSFFAISFPAIIFYVSQYQFSNEEHNDEPTILIVYLGWNYLLGLPLWLFSLSPVNSYFVIIGCVLFSSAIVSMIQRQIQFQNKSYDKRRYLTFLVLFIIILLTVRFFLAEFSPPLSKSGFLPLNLLLIIIYPVLSLIPFFSDFMTRYHTQLYPSISLSHSPELSESRNLLPLSIKIGSFFGFMEITLLLSFLFWTSTSGLL